jgi:aldehyde:ferredoxin oxidoreductase
MSASKLSIEEIRKQHRVVAEFEYERGQVNRGYTNRTLYVNLSDGTIQSKPVADETKDIFIGGRGFGLWYLWQAVGPDTKWNDPENEIILSSGPIGGITQYPGSGKTLVVSLSPTTGIVIDSNVGGYFGPLLKFAGWDALEVQGKADKDVLIVIDGNEGRVTIEEAPAEEVDAHLISEQLTDMYADSMDSKRDVSVVSAGKGSEHGLIGCLNVSFYDVRRKAPRIKQAGRGGIGTVFRDKRIKGIVVKYSGVRGDTNHPADLERIKAAGVRLHKEIHDNDHLQCHMRTVGTAHLVEIMNDYDLLPIHNYKFGSHKDAEKIASPIWKNKFTQGVPDGCWYGCTLACAHAIDEFKVRTGPYKGSKVIVDGPEYETAAGVGSNCGIFNPDDVAELNFYCDTYGIDTISWGTCVAFVMECYETGILNKDITGGIDLKFGNADASLELLHQLARGEGFGVIVGQGVRKMRELFVKEYGADPQFLFDIGMECKGLEYSQYISKESLAQQGGFGLTNKGPQHDEAWLIFMDMVNNQIPTFEDKAEALHYFPLFRTWFGLNGLCKLPWNDVEPPDNAQTDEPAKVPEHVQNYVDLFSGVTGREVAKEDLISMSEGVYNFQRVFNLRMGQGRREHDDIPYRSAGPVTVEEYESRRERYDRQLSEKVGVNPEGKSTEEKVAIMREYRLDQYDKLRDAVYKRRGWTNDGVPTLETLKKFKVDFPEVIEVVEPHL